MINIYRQACYEIPYQLVQPITTQHFDGSLLEWDDDLKESCAQLMSLSLVDAQVGFVGRLFAVADIFDNPQCFRGSCFVTQLLAEYHEANMKPLFILCRATPTNSSERLKHDLGSIPTLVLFFHERCRPNWEAVVCN